MEGLILVGLLVQFFIFFIMLAIGIEVSPSELKRISRDGPLIVRTLLINLLIIPLITYFFLRFAGADDRVGIALMVGAASPGAPFAPRVVEMAKAQVAVSVVMVLILAIISVFSGPLIARLGLGSEGSVDLSRIILALLFFQLLPLAAGLILRHKWPEGAVKLGKLSRRLSNLLLAAVAILFFREQGLDIFRMGLDTWMWLIAMSVLWGVLGWLSGGRWRHTQSVVAATRNIGLALLLALGGFGGKEVVMPIFALGLLSLTLVPAVGRIVGRRFA